MNQRHARPPAEIDVMLEHRASILDAYSHDPRWSIRAEVARNFRTAISTLRRLSRDASAAVRSAVAGNRKTDRLTLVALAMDDDPEVIDAVASHPDTPAQVVVRLVGDVNPPSDRSVLRWALGTRSHVPDVIIQRLLASDDPVVRRETIVALGRLR